MIEVKQITDKVFEISWDENDPVESQFNTWKEEDFIQAISQHLESLENEESGEKS